MLRNIVVLGLFAIACTLLVTSYAGTSVAAAPQAAAPQAAAPAQPPSHGYDVHVLAPHLVDGHQMGPYHHYCKTYSSDPVIVCLIYDTTAPNAMLSQVEWIYAKKLTRNQVSLKDWNKNWHDHQIEISGGRVKVLDMPDEEAKKVAELVSTTDGLIYHFYFDGKIPNAKMSIAQAVGHKPMTMAEWKNYEGKMASK